jgi:hypothetical protein
MSGEWRNGLFTSVGARRARFAGGLWLTGLPEASFSARSRAPGELPAYVRKSGATAQAGRAREFPPFGRRLVIRQYNFTR